MTTQAVADILNADRERLAQLETAEIVFPEEREPAPAPRGRKSVAGNKGKSTPRLSLAFLACNADAPSRSAVDDGPTPQEAQDDFAKGKEAIDRLLKVRLMLAARVWYRLTPRRRAAGRAEAQYGRRGGYQGCGGYGQGRVKMYVYVFVSLLGMNPPCCFYS